MNHAHSELAAESFVEKGIHLPRKNTAAADSCQLQRKWCGDTHLYGVEVAEGSVVAGSPPLTE